jgi:hypothetical protein
MGGLVAWPGDTQVDDSGAGADGTVWNEAWSDAAKASIEDQVVSAVNPLVKPKTITDEVIAARGSKASLDARLDVALNEDGTPKPATGQATEAQVVSFAAGNWIQNDSFLIWHAGDAAAPAGWTLAGAGSAILRCGTGLGDTTTKVGPMCPKVTRAAADATLSQPLLNATSYAAAGACLVGRKFAFGAWVYCAVANMARVRMYEGAAGADTATSYHTGVAGWQFISGVHTVTAGASELTLVLEVKNSAGDAYFSGATAVPGDIALTNWIPCPKVYGALVFKKSGTLPAAPVTTLDNYMPARPLLVKDVQLCILTPPGAVPVIVDVNVYDGAVYQSMFSTKPQIAAGAGSGVQAPDGTYRYRCINGGRGAGAAITNCKMSWDIDQSGTAPNYGADLLVTIRCLQYARPQESLLDVADF